MASNVAGAPLAGLLSKLLARQSGERTFAYALRPASMAATRRLFSSKGSALGRCDDDGNMSSGSEAAAAAKDRRRTRDFPDPRTPNVFGGPFSLQTIILGKPMEKKKASPAAGTTRKRKPLPPAPWWLTQEYGRELTLLAPMPGLGKEHVKVCTDQDTLMIEGDGGEEFADAGDDFMARYHRYTGSIQFPGGADKYKMRQVRAEMKNGLLKITVPKGVDEECAGVTRVTVE